MSKKKKKGQGIAVACGDVVRGVNKEGKEVKGTVYRISKKKGFVRVETKGGAHHRLLVDSSFKIVKEDADARRRSSLWARNTKDEEGKEGKKKGKKKDKKDKAEKKKGKKKDKKDKVKGKGKSSKKKKRNKHEDSNED